MNRKEIINFLLESDIEDVKEISYDNALVVRFCYDFDNVDLLAARACANDEVDYEEDSIEWIKEGVIPYLDDIAQDRIEELIEDVVEEFQLVAEFISYEINLSNYSYKEFLAVFAPEDEDIDIDSVRVDLNII